MANYLCDFTRLCLFIYTSRSLSKDISVGGLSVRGSFSVMVSGCKDCSWSLKPVPSSGPACQWCQHISNTYIDIVAHYFLFPESWDRIQCLVAASQTKHIDVITLIPVLPVRTTNKREWSRITGSHIVSVQPWQKPGKKRARPIEYSKDDARSSLSIMGKFASCVCCCWC